MKPDVGALLHITLEPTAACLSFSPLQACVPCVSDVPNRGGVTAMQSVKYLSFVVC